MLQNLSLNVHEYEQYLVDTYEDTIMSHTGIHYIFRFPNGYGASVVKSYGSCGYEQDLWELAVILYEEETDKLEPSEYILVYPKEILSNGIPLGYLTDEQVFETLKKIKTL